MNRGTEGRHLDPLILKSGGASFPEIVYGACLEGTHLSSLDWCPGNWGEQRCRGEVLGGDGTARNSSLVARVPCSFVQLREH